MIRAAAAALLALAACAEAQAPANAPVFPVEACERRTLVDARNGHTVLGAEDLALSEDGEQLFVSAYDRLAVEEALTRGLAVPAGALYRMPVRALLLGDVAAQPLLAGDAVEGGLRPHGLAVSGERVALVNRTIRNGDIHGEIVEFRIAGDDPVDLHTRREDDWCAANDVALRRTGLAASLDRARCPGWAFGERVFGLRRGSVRSSEGGVLADGLAFANGLATLPDGGLAVAETRARQVRVVRPDGTERVFPVDGAPDNLNLAADGRLIVAVQPRLIPFARYRFGEAERAASRILALDLETGGQTLLFEDPDGALFSGATAAVRVGDALIAGSVGDRGLLVCRAPGE